MAVQRLGRKIFVNPVSESDPLCIKNIIVKGRKATLINKPLNLTKTFSHITNSHLKVYIEIED